MKQIKIPWDKYEAALLIETYLKIKNGEVSRTIGLQKLSNMLRAKAIHEGKEIDSYFRNYNGMCFMINSIATTFQPNKYSIHGSNLFTDMVSMYKTDIIQFNKILNEAHCLANNSSTIKCVLHIKYGYGVVIAEVNGILDIQFDTISEIKHIQKGHETIREISSEEYLENSKNPLCNSVELNHRFNFDTDDYEKEFYNYIEKEYAKNHENDGKAHRASKHAKKCVDIMLVISDILHADVFTISTINDLNEIKTKLAEKKTTIDEGDYKWYLYDLSRYESFLMNKFNLKQDKQSLQKPIISEELIDCSEYQIVLNKCFPEGFSYNNPIQKRKFIRLFEEEIGKNLVDSDDIYLKKITNSGFVCENRVYPLSIVSESLKDEIQTYIDNNLNNESPAIYYNSLFDVFRNSLSEIFDENMLKGYASLAFKDRYNFESDFISLKGQDIDLRQCLIDLFMKFGKPLYKEEIYCELPNISPDAIDGLLTDKDFVLNFRGKSYFYIDVFNIDDDELKDIELFISEKIREKEQLTGSELYEYVQECLPGVIESNPEVTDLGVRNAIREHFRDKFRFKGDVISSLDNKVDVKTLYENFCKNHERFSFEELEGFRDSIRQSYIDYEAVFSKMVRINQNEFIRRDLVNFDINRIDNALLNYCGGEYISFNDIINFTDFPSIQYLWNNYVLESYLYCCSRKFKLLHATFNKEMPVGGIVKKISNIETFDDLLVHVIKDNKLFDRDKAFEFLLENNIILTRKVKNIDLLIEKAKQEV